MKILSIDTSCDDTCISLLKIVNCKLKILSNIVSSQTKIHAKYGGVYPSLAKREHQKNLVPVLKKALKKAEMLKQFSIFTVSKDNSPEGHFQFSKKSQSINSKFKTVNRILERERDLLEKLTEFLKKYQKPNVDLIAVTVGPGLEPCLWMGINFARALSHFWELPIAPVNHIEAHIAANFIGGNSKFHCCQGQLPGGSITNSKTIFPAVCLVASGGHTELLLMENIGKYKLLGETRDDAAGECLDKTARILGLSYPGGPAIEKIASQWKSKIHCCQGQLPGGSNPKSKTNFKSQILNSKTDIKLPRPMFNSKDYDFSFSGLKTAVLYLVKKLGQKKLKNIRLKAEIAAEIEQAIIDVLILKTLKAAKEFKAKTILLGGGVIANKELRKQIKKVVKKQYPIPNVQYPISKLCTDNAAMAGVAGYLTYIRANKKRRKKIGAQANLKLV